MTRSPLFLLGAVGLLATAASAFAGVVQIRDGAGGETSSGGSNGYFLDGTGGTIKATYTGSKTFESIPEGTFDAEINDGSGWQRLWTYCIEPTDTISFGVQAKDKTGETYRIDELTNAGFTKTGANYAEILWSNAFDLSTKNETNAAAFQSLLWEIATDGDKLNLTSGTFKMSSTGSTGLALEVAQGWLENIAGGKWTSATPLFALTSDCSQNLLMALPDAQTQAVPEASTTMLLLGVGLGGAIWYRRKKA